VEHFGGPFDRRIHRFPPEPTFDRRSSAFNSSVSALRVELSILRDRFKSWRVETNGHGLGRLITPSAMILCHMPPFPPPPPRS
jgi:hypothetical protein